MKSLLLCSTTLLAAASLMAADKDDVTSAVQKLAAADNYSWTTTREGGQNGAGGASKGKAQKDGLLWTSMTARDNTVEGYVKGGKGALKTEDGWQAVDLAAGARGGGGGGGGGGRGTGVMLRNLKAPTAQAEDILSKTTVIAKAGDAYTGDLTEEGAKALLALGGGGRRGGGGGGGGGGAPAISNPKGSVKFWITDGVMTKYQFKVSGTRKNQDGDDVAIDRTVTVEIKDIGTTKIDVPDEAKSKLSSCEPP
jgi:hypothetical protein